MKVNVGVSNRHFHATRDAIDILFGKDYELTIKNQLNQPEQFSANEVVIIKTIKSEIKNVRILGPIREYNQVEISKTDAYKLGLNPPIRHSGDILNSEKVTVIGPKGSISIEGCIIPNRHIHISRKQASQLNIKEDDIVSIRVDSIKGGILNNTYIKISDEAYFELHLDTDDANSHLLKQNDVVEILELKDEHI
ncbi:MAG: phosphate propanoyltransferase [Bacilli bacterium]